MFWKSMSDRSAPHHGIGRISKYRRLLSRIFRIHSGSFFSAEISSTTSVESPRLGVKIEWSASFQSKRYPLLSSLRCSSWLIATASSSPCVLRAGPRRPEIPAAHTPKVYRSGRIRPREGGGSLPHLHGGTHERAVLGPRAVVVLDVHVPQQLLQGEPGVRAPLSDPAVRDDLPVRGDALALIELAQL